ncbi:MAG: hypothetical protein AB7N80_11675 [Bdellovibrionales bacterium]
MKQIVIFTLLCGALVGCDKSSNNNATVPPFIGKPLPEECISAVRADLHWPADYRVMQYRLRLRLANTQRPYFEMTTAGGGDGLQIEIDRGGALELSVERMMRLGQVHSWSAKVYIPTCVERERFRRLHPEYEEPIDFKLEWPEP